ncbi:MAG: DUF2911 domain-containing protein [Flavobacteriales bacterium]|nr:DUF2911 domain-containing protein [Flavobacteriales bacterium]
MKLTRLIAVAIFSLILNLNFSQELPKASPLGKVEQLVGLTNISIEYSRPSVKGRKIFGQLLPFDEVWRLGANKSTIITTDQTLKFGDQILPAGSYAMFATPMKEKWEIAFNSNTEQWGTGEYDKSLNVVTLVVETIDCEHVETLTMAIGDLTFDSGSIFISWEKIRVEIPFKVNTKKQAKKNIEEAIAKGENLDLVYYNASRYFFDLNNNEDALNYIDLSIKSKKTFKNLYHKAKILAATGQKKEAIKLGDEAIGMAQAEKEDGWISYMMKSIEEWKK